MDTYTPFGTIQEDVDHQTLKDNRDWVEASLRLYQANYNSIPTLEDLADYDGDDLRSKLADYGLVQMAGFNFNIVDQALDTNTMIKKADKRAKEAFVYMLDQYDQVNTSWKTAGDAAWEMATDATNWLGLITAGTGAAVGFAAKQAGKKVVKNKIKKEVKKSLGKTAGLAGLEGAAHGAAFDVMDQSVRMDAGSQEEYSLGQTALSTGVGFAAGATIGTGIDIALARFGNKKAQQTIEEKAAQDKRAAQEAAEEDAFEESLDLDGANNKVMDEDGNVSTPKEEPQLKEEQQLKEEPQPKEDVDVDEEGTSWKTEEDYDKVVKDVDEKVATDPIEDEFTGVKFGQLVLRDSRDLVKIRAETVITEIHANPDFVDDVIKRFENLKTDRRTFSTLVREFNTAYKYFAEMEIELYRIKADPKSSAAKVKKAEEQLELIQPLTQKAYVGKTHMNSYSSRDLNLAKIGKIKIKRNEDGTVSDEAYALAYENQILGKMNEVEAKYLGEINRLLGSEKEGDFAKGLELIKQRDEEMSILRGQLLMEGGDETLYKKINNVTEKWVEASISGVFSPSTVMINTVFPLLKNYTYPLLDQIINSPLSLTKWRRMVRVYGQMFAAHEAARKSFHAAWEFEQTLLTKDVSRFLGEGIKIKGNLKQYMRTFPRLLGATDAYNQELAAAGFITGEAFDRLLTKGMAMKKKGNDLKKYIDDNIDDEIAKAYDEAMTLDALKPVYEKGVALKLEGDELEKYVLDSVNKFGNKTFRRLGNDTKVKELREEAAKLRKKKAGTNPEALALEKEADELEKIGLDARDYVETLLYKKKFETNKSGVFGAIESTADKLEKMHRHHPLAKIFGQLFFRTPAWVFHESMRLTPAINVMLPQFRNDLAGLNGVGRQARAQTEASLAFFLMMFATTKWAQGEITGSAHHDFTMTGEQETDELGALTIQFGDEGKHFDYRRYEPLRIPLTIVVNTLDGIMATKAREEYGESDPELMDRTLAGMGIAMSTLLSAFQDSALLTGLVDTITAGFRMTDALTSDDPDGKENAYNVASDLLMKKAMMVVPSTIKKSQIAFGGDDELTAPVDYQQRLLASFSPNHPSLPRKYDIFGNPRRVDNPMTVMNPFWYTTPEQRRAGRSEKEMHVINWINELEQLGFGNFTRSKFKSSKFPVDDLREAEITYDGMKVSLYDAMMIELNKPYIKNELVNELYALSNSPDSLGNPEDREEHSYRVKDAKKAIRAAKEYALDAVLGNANNKLISDDKPLAQIIEEREVEIQKARDGIFK